MSDKETAAYARGLEDGQRLAKLAGRGCAIPILLALAVMVVLAVAL